MGSQRRRRGRGLSIAGAAAATAIVGLVGSTAPAGGVSCDVVAVWEVTNGAGSPVTPQARVLLSGRGTATVDIELALRRATDATVFYVDAGADPGGDGASQTSAFDDMNTAIAAIAAGSTSQATVIVADGTYVWGDAGSPPFDLNVIGAGSGHTVFEHAGADTYAAQFRGRSIYIEGATFRGGSSALDLRNNPMVTLVDVELTGATTGNGLNLRNVPDVVVASSSAHHNFADGFNYHSTIAGPVRVLEMFSNGSDNGVGGAWNSQGSTIHDNVTIVRVGGRYERNPTNISDVGSGASWNIDIVTSEPRSNAQGGEYLNYNASGTVVGRIVSGDLAGGSQTPTVVRANSSSEIRHSSRFNTLAGATLTGNQFIADDSFVEPHECEPTPTSTVPSATSTVPPTGNTIRGPAAAYAPAERTDL